MRRIVFLGQKDHGKSTLIGSLLMQTGSVSEDRLTEARKACDDSGIEFEPAYLLDTIQDERAKGMTFDSTRGLLQIENELFELIDVPGHEELISSMMSGSSYADAALVVVSAEPGEGFTDQTARHIFVSNLLGIDRFVIAINKLDVSSYREEVFRNLESQMMSYFRSINQPTKHIRVVPISAREGVNLTSLSDITPWYKGRFLTEELTNAALLSGEDGSDIHAKESEPRLIVQSVIDQEGNKAILGQVLNGTITRESNLLVVPGWNPLSIDGIVAGMDRTEIARRGESIALITNDPNVSDLRGSVITDKNYRGHISDNLKARVFFARAPDGDIQISILGISLRVVDFSVLERVDPVNGKKLDSMSIKPMDSAVVLISIEKPIAFDTFANNQRMGRLVLRSGRSLIGAGIVLPN